MTIVLRLEKVKFVIFLLFVTTIMGDISISGASIIETSYIPYKKINFTPGHPMIPGEILVKFRSGTFKEDSLFINEALQDSHPSLDAKFNQLNVKSIKRVFQRELKDIYRLQFDETYGILDALQLFADEPEVEWAEPNYVFSIFVTPNDPHFPKQWGLAKIQADLAWDISQGRKEVVIAVIDTGVDYNHLDLANNIWYNEDEFPNNGIDDDINGYADDYMGWDFVSVTKNAVPEPDPNEDIFPPDNNPMDFQGHGTHCSGIASAVTNNSVGVAGTTWNCKIMCLRAGYATASGSGSLAYSDSALAIEYAVNNKADVISMSWGSSTSSNAIQEVIEYAYSKGCVLVAAAGNSGGSTPNYPAAYPGVIAVAASDQSDGRTSFTNYGSWVDIAAPGKDIYSTKFDSSANNDTYTFLNGTSMATPYVAGTAALIISKTPGITANMVSQRLLDSADPITWDVPSPNKRLNTYQAVILGSFYINVTKPGNGELIKGNAPYEITWKTGGENIDHIHLLFSQNGGTSYQNIMENTENDGKYQWLIPEINSSLVKIKAIAEDANNTPLAEFITGNFMIDSAAPETTYTLNGTAGDGGWFRTDVTVNLSSIDNLSGLKETRYKIDNGSWQIYSSPFIVSGTTIYYYSVDKVGNIENVKSIEVKIDKVPPVTTLNPSGESGKNGWYKSDITINLNATDGLSGPKESRYKIGDGPWQIYTSSFNLTNTAKIYYYSLDIAGNAEIEKSMEFKIDKSSPETSVALTGTMGDNGWYVSDVTVKLTAVDNLSGVGKTQYKIDNGAWQIYSSPFIVSGSMLYYNSEDIAGNIETEKSMELKIDKSPPVMTINLDGIVGKNGWYQSQLTVKLLAEDLLSGVDSIQYKIGNGVWENYTSPFTIASRAILYYKSRDKAGNVKPEQSLDVKIDSVKPESSLALSGDMGNNNWYKSDVMVSITGTDDVSGIMNIKYKIGDGDWQTYSSPFMVDNSVVYYQAEDNAGNIESEKSELIKVDKLPPETNIILAGDKGKNGWYRSDVNVTLSPTDDRSGIEKTEYNIADGAWQGYSSPFVVKGSVVHYRSQDKAGNLEMAKSTEIKIDKMAPKTTAIITGTEGEQGWYISDLKVSLSATDDKSGLGEIQYKVDGGTWITYTSPFTFSGATLQYRSEDIAGNMEIEQSRTFKIDKTPPSVPIVTDDGKLTNSKTQLHASWTPSIDVQSGVTEYKYAINTKPEQDSSLIWNSAGLNTEINITGLNLEEGKTYYILVTAKNEAGLWSKAGSSDGITVNTPPIVRSIPNISFPEDTSYSGLYLDNYMSDSTNDNKEITWTCTGNKNIIVNIDPNTHIVTFTPISNWNGSENITFTATDSEGLSSSNTPTITVTPINDPPTVSNLSIGPLPPKPNSELRAYYIYHDVDEGEDNSQIRWYKNEELQPFDNLLVIPSSAIFPRDKWYFTIVPYDGIDAGEMRISPSVIISGAIQELHFYPGLNLFSLYVNVANSNILSILSPIDGIYKALWNYDSVSKAWKSYVPGRSDNTLDKIEPGRGYLIDVVREVVLTIIGENISNSSVPLNSGWNLVGYALPTSQTLEEALSSIKYSSLWSYDNLTKTWNSHFSKGPSFLNKINSFTPGNGYWIYVEDNAIWTVK